MEKKIISFKGISNVPDDGLNEAGDMSVLLNMRHKGGELVPCRRPAESSGFTNIKQSLYHANSKLWLFLTVDGYLHYFKDNDYEDGANDIGASGVESFAIMGNIVIMNFADRVEYAIWRNGGFEYLGALPRAPRLRCNLSFKTVKSGSTKYYGGIREAEAAGYPQLWEGYNKKGELDVCLSNLYDSGAYIDFANFRLALKLFDGTYKDISPVYLVNGTRTTVSDKEAKGGKQNFKWLSNTDYTSENEYWAEIEGFIPSFELEEYDFENWSDIVSSVCLFTSGSLPMHGVKKGVPEYIYEQLLSNDYEDYLPLTAEEFKGNLLNANYYKIAEYDLKGVLIDSVKNTSPSNLSQQEILVLKDLNDYASNSQVCVNSKLHSYGIKTLYPNGFADVWAYGGDDDDVDKIVVKTFVKTEEGDVETIAECNGCKSRMSGLFTYPNRDAYKMDVYVKKATVLSGLSERLYSLYYKSFELTKDNAFAYYINPECWQINSIEITSDLDYNVEVANANWILEKFQSNSLNVVYDEKGWWTINGNRAVVSAFFKIGTPKAGDSFIVKISRDNPKTVFNYGDFEAVKSYNVDFKDAELQWENIGDTTYKTLKDFTVYKTRNAIDVITYNILKVSAVDNPFYFPTAQTYKFEGDIVGLASNAEAVSPGQFGQFPLYVFTKTGIWTMQVDTSGKGAYTMQSPASREVCNGAICPVSGGVVFATDKGLMAISGGQVSDLSAALDGFEVDFFKYNAEMWNAIFAKAGKGVVNPVPIREYIQGENGNVKGESSAKLAYNYLHNEVILSNVNYGYSYVYSLTNQVWSVIDTVFDLTTNKYPELVVFDKAQGNMFTFADGESGAVPVVAITRPFTLGSFDFKRLRQAGLRTTFEGQLNFYLLGSNDGAEFKCITGVESGKRKAENLKVKAER